MTLSELKSRFENRSHIQGEMRSIVAAFLATVVTASMPFDDMSARTYIATGQVSAVKQPATWDPRSDWNHVGF